jgi:O-antigen/teichoic acid export membrane protein
LQGQQRFFGFGLMRTAHAVGRLAVGLLTVSLIGGAVGALVAFPIGSLLSLLLGLAFLGRMVWRPAPAMPGWLVREGLRLMGGALVAYVAYMVLLTSDLIWVNRSLGGDLAGSYASAVLLRRVLTLLPGAVIAIMFPRAVVQVARKQVPDRLLAKTAAVVAIPTLIVTALYFAFGSAIVRIALGPGYAAAGPLLGWMGLAMLGYNLGSIWLNFYLASRALPFVLLLGCAAIAQNLALALFHASLLEVTAVFALGGWVLAAGGLLIYWFGLRPRLLLSAGDRQTTPRTGDMVEP